MNTPDVLTLPQAEAVAARVRAVSGVADLHAGRFGEVALLFPRARVHGLRTGPDGGLEVHVVVDLDAVGTGTDLHTLSARIRKTVGAVVDLPTDVVLADAVYRTGI